MRPAEEPAPAPALDRLRAMQTACERIEAVLKELKASDVDVETVYVRMRSGTLKVEISV